MHIIMSESQDIEIISMIIALLSQKAKSLEDLIIKYVGEFSCVGATNKITIIILNAKTASIQYKRTNRNNKKNSLFVKALFVYSNPANHLT